MTMGSCLSIITLNVNGLNAPTKRQRLADWIQKQDPYIRCLQETHFKIRDTYRLKVKGWKNIFHANRDQKKAGEAILISGKIDFKIKSVSHFLIGSFIFLELSHRSCLYIFEINPVSIASFAIIISQSEGCLFTLLIVSFVVQKLLSFIRSHLFIFAFISNILGGGS